MKRKLIINESAKKILFKGRIVRTPVYLMVTDSEFKLLEVQLRTQGISDYRFVDNWEIDKKVNPEIDLGVEIEIIKPTKKNKEDMTTLERLASE